MKISILLPYKENYSTEYAGAVSIFVNGVNKYTVYLPPKVMKMTNGVNVNIGETIGKILEKRAVQAIERGDTTQLFSYPISYKKPNFILLFKKL